MIPGTVLGLVLFAASLGPGFLFVQERAKRRPAPEQSPLEEAVEMLVIGALASILSATLVLSVGEATNALDENRIASDVGEYLVTEPIRGFGSVLVFFALAYGSAWAAGSLLFRKHEPVFNPAGTSWVTVFWNDRPAADTVPLVTVELRDGRKVVGVLRSFTAELADSREIALAAPIAVQRSAAHKLENIDDHFLVLREQDILYIAGRYSRPDRGDTTS